MAPFFSHRSNVSGIHTSRLGVAPGLGLSASLRTQGSSSRKSKLLKIIREYSLIISSSCQVLGTESDVWGVKILSHHGEFHRDTSSYNETDRSKDRCLGDLKHIIFAHAARYV
ncbi:hypothetical protein AAMO2058_001307400 [Amorphochlora amoebiformis]